MAPEAAKAMSATLRCSDVAAKIGVAGASVSSFTDANSSSMGRTRRRRASQTTAASVRFVAAAE